MIDERFILPEWVQAEKMERIVPLDELLSYQDTGLCTPLDSDKEGSRTMKLFSRINKKKKRHIFLPPRSYGRIQQPLK